MLLVGLISGISSATSPAQAVNSQISSSVNNSESGFILDPAADPISTREVSVRSAVDLVLAQNAAAWGITPSDWRITRIGQLRSGRDVVTLTQHASGIPILGTSMVLSFSSDQALTSVQYQTSKLPASVSPGFSKSVAQAKIESLARDYWNDAAGELTTTEPALVVLRDGLYVKSAPATLAYEANVFRVGSIQGLKIRIDAHTASGLSTTPTEKAVTQSPAVCDANQQFWNHLTTICIPGHEKELLSPNANAVRLTEIVQDISDLYEPRMSEYPFDLDGDPNTPIAALTFNEMVGNALVDGGPRPVSIVLNFCYTYCPSAWANAFWGSFPSQNGSQAGVGADYWFGGMFIGQGFETSDDVIAHEMTHGVTGGYVSFDYQLQSGAIDESMADIFGESVDQLDHRIGEVPSEEAQWLIAEDADLPGTTYDGPYRSMANPTLMSDPDRVGSANFKACTVVTENNDGCYVHTNSGVPNKLAYLIARGGNFNGQSIAPLSADADTSVSLMNELFFDVLAMKSTSTMTFKQLGEAVIASCAELYPYNNAFTPTACANVKKAVFATQLTAVSSAKPIVSKTTVKKGYSFTATSKIRLLTGAYPGAVSVKFQFKKKGSTAWSTLATKTTSATGAYKLTIKPRYSGYYRVYVPATATRPAAVSATAYVAVKK